MINANVKNFITVVMDGTHTETVNFVKDIIDDLTHKEFGEATCRPLDEKHPSMILIETKTEPDVYNVIQQVIDIALPARCIFNPPI